MSLKELREHADKGPSLEELDGWVPLFYTKDQVFARKKIGDTFEIKPFEAKGVWKKVLDWLKKREHILRVIEESAEEKYEFVPEEESKDEEA